MDSQDLFKKYGIDIMPMAGAPFGVDDQGRKVADVGRSVKVASELMMEQVRAKAGSRLPSGLPTADREKALEAASQEALDHLAQMLNQSIRDKRYQVTGEYLRDAGNYYSFEFNMIANSYAGAISGDPDFFYNRGAVSIPQALVWITRPFTVAQRFEAVPRLAARFVKADLRVIKVSGNTAILEWHAREVEQLPAEYREMYLSNNCLAWKGLMASIPKVTAGLPMATARDVPVSDGDPYGCAWELRWQEPPRTRYMRPWVGLAASAALLAGALLAGPGLAWLAFLVPVPVLVGWYSARHDRVRIALQQQRDQLMEQQHESDQQHIDLLETSRDLQQANIGLKKKIEELTTLQEVGLVISSSLELDTVLDQVVSLVRSRLHFDRTAIFLLDEERQMLVARRSSGGTDQIQGVLNNLEIPLNLKHWSPVKSLLSGQPIIETVDNAPDDALGLLKSLGSKAFISVPLRVQDKPVGVLVADNASSDRPITQDDAEVLLALGRSVAIAVQNVHLYQSVEEYSQTLEQKVEERSSQLREANEELIVQREAADSANKAKSQFLANMSHELRTPLNAIIGYSELVMEEAADLEYTGITLLTWRKSARRANICSH